MHHGRYRRIIAVLCAFGGVLMITISAASAATIPASASQTGVISPTPALNTPELSDTGTPQNVQQLAQCGSTMYAVGSFNSITWKRAAYYRNNVFSFSATAPYKVSSWAPDVNGTVDTIAFDGADCSHAYIGGTFSSVNGVAVENIAEISTVTGAVDTSFAHTAGATVQTMLVTGTHLLTGGSFKSINGSDQPYYISLNVATGRDDGYLNLDISGNYVYPGVRPNGTGINNQQLSHNGQRLLVEGDFTSVGGEARQQIFMLSLGTSAATLTGWTSPEFDQYCGVKEPFYVRAAAWSPDDDTVYLATTGLHLYNWDHKFPLTGLCDAASAFPATETSVDHDWINYTGCDSLYSVVADADTVFVAGHPRWSENAYACNNPGKGSVSDIGLQGLDPATGEPQLDSDGSAVYTMGRANADDMILTTAGLWIASSDHFNIQSCGGRLGHAGICFLPYE